MRRLAPLLVLLLAFPAAALDLPRTNEKWISLRVDELEIISSAPAAATIAIAEDLVRMRAAIGEVTRLKVRSPLTTKVFVFATERAFAPYCDLVFQRDAENIAGVFVGRDDGNFILFRADAQSGSSRIVFHELTHYFISNTVAGLPLWLNEGLAEYYSTVKTIDNEVHIGRPIPEHVRWLRDESLIPLRDLFAIDRESAIYNEGSRQGVFYAQSWALVHYLMLANDERRAQFSKFLSLLGKGKPQQEAFESAFGIPYAKMEGDLRAYVRRPTFNYAKYALSDLTVTEVPRPEPLTYAAYVYELGDLLVHSGPSNAAIAEQFMIEALKANPANAAAHADMGRLHEGAGRTLEAEKAYQRAVQLGSDEAEMYVLYGAAIINRLARIEGKVPNDELLRARKLFERAAQLDPSSARAWAGIGTTYTATTEDSAPGIAALEKSLALSPADVQAAANLVQLYAQNGRRADATRLIDTIIVPAGDRELIARARDMLYLADLHDVQSLAAAGEMKEAIALATTVLQKTKNPTLANHVRDLIASMESWETAQANVMTFNDAITKANGGQYAEALAIVDGLLPNITDPEMLEKAKEFREEIAERAKRRRK